MLAVGCADKASNSLIKPFVRRASPNSNPPVPVLPNSWQPH